MRISNLSKNKWEKGEEWFEKWYSTEQCYLAFHFNPLTKSFITQGLDSIALNTQWFYEINISNKWNKDQRKAANSSVPFFQTLITDLEKYISQAEIKLKKIQSIPEIDLKIFPLIKDTMQSLWFVFLADIGKYLGDRIDEILKNKNLSRDQIDEIKNYYLTPRQPLEYQLEGKNLERIKEMLVQRGELKNLTLKSLPKDILRLLKEHQKKYAWLTTSDIDTRPASINSYLNRLKELDSTNNYAQPETTLIVDIKSALNRNDLFLLDLINKLLYVDNYAADLYGKIDFIFQQLLSKKYKIPFKDLSWYNFSELESLIKNGVKLTSSDLSLRKKFRVMVQIDGKIRTFYGKKDFQQAVKLLGISKPKKVNYFKGTIASLGCVKGVVKILRGARDINKVKKGDVIVVNTTHPDLMPAIRRCIAIITNHGGVTSHAAIVSRELKIPCVVGTHIATDVLRDGDFVEVDANNGIVRILNHAN